MDTFCCPICGQSKPLSEFNKHHRRGPLETWNIRQCKTCAHDQYQYRRSIPDQRRTQMEASRAWKKQNPERHRELAREYRQRHPEKIMAQNRLNYAVRKGRIDRQPCEVCGATYRIHAHHQSYDPKDWYNVRWLCNVCHEIEHG